MTNKLAWSSIKLVNADAGTYYSLRGGQIHAGSGASLSDVRTLLFWTFNPDPKTDKSYDVDSQETRLTLIVSLGNAIWRNLIENGDERKQMLYVMSYVLKTCSQKYIETCVNTLQNYPKIPTLIRQMKNWPLKTDPNDDTKQVYRNVKDYISKKNNDLFNQKNSNNV